MKLHFKLFKLVISIAPSYSFLVNKAQKNSQELIETKAWALPKVAEREKFRYKIHPVAKVLSDKTYAPFRVDLAQIFGEIYHARHNQARL